MNPLRLEHMTVFDARPVELVDIAESFEIPFISVFLADAMAESRPVTRGDAPELIKRLRSSSVAVDTAEVFYLQPDPSTAEPLIALAAELGARTIVALHVIAGDEYQAAEELASLAALAGQYGLNVSLEPISMGLTRTPAEGARVVELSRASNAGLTLDLLHLVRTGTAIETIADLNPALISSVQLCDGAAEIDPALAIEEAGYERGIAGSGSFPIIPFLRHLPDSAVIGMEVPLKSLRKRGMSAKERTRLVVEATRELQRAAVK